MKEQFDKIESQLRKFIEGNAARLFSDRGVDLELAHQLAVAMESESKPNGQGGFIAPSNYALYIHSTYAKDVRANNSLLESLANHLKLTAEKNGVRFNSPPSITIIPDDNVDKGDFNIKVFQDNSFVEETHAMIPEFQSTQINIPNKAFIIIKGDAIVSLEKPLISIGRNPENEICLEESRVSRKHAQLRAVNGEYIIVDLESSGGTFVNGERITQTSLQPGDVISISGVMLIYGEDAARTLAETQEYNPSDSVD